MSRAESTKYNARKAGGAFTIALLVPFALFYEELVASEGGDSFSAWFGLVVTWLIGMFFIMRAVHRPWRKGRVAAAVWIGLFIALGGLLEGLILAELDPAVSGLSEEEALETLGGMALVFFIAWMIAASVWTRSINKRVKKTEERRKKKEKKKKKRAKEKPVTEQPAQESVEEHVQESVEEHAQESGERYYGYLGIAWIALIIGSIFAMIAKHINKGLANGYDFGDGPFSFILENITGALAWLGFGPSWIHGILSLLLGMLGGAIGMVWKDDWDGKTEQYKRRAGPILLVVGLAFAYGVYEFFYN